MGIEKLAFRIFRRVFVKLLRIAGFLLALVGGALIEYSALTSGSLSPMRFGGIVAVVGGIVLLIITSFTMPAILVFVAGIIGIIAAAMKPPWWKFWKR